MPFGAKRHIPENKAEKELRFAVSSFKDILTMIENIDQDAILSVSLMWKIQAIKQLCENRVSWLNNYDWSDYHESTTD